jgi:hypothetical protein
MTPLCMRETTLKHPMETASRSGHADLPAWHAFMICASVPSTPTMSVEWLSAQVSTAMWD